MDDKHLHIDEWLKKAAAQPPAPENTGMAAKQQAWSRMAALLDEDERDQPKPRIFPFRLNWAAILISFITLSAAAAVTVVLINRRQADKQPSAHPAEKTQQHTGHNARQSNRNDTPYTYIQQLPQSMPADTANLRADGLAGKPAGLPEGTPAAPAIATQQAANNTVADNAGGAKGNAHTAAANTGAVKDNTTAAAGNTGGIARNAKAAAANEKAGSSAVLPGGIKKEALLTSKPLRNKTERGLLNNKVNAAAVPGSTADNEPLVTPQRDLSVGPSKEITAKKEPAGGAHILYPLPTRNVFALQLPSLSSASRDQHVNAASAGGLSMGVAHTRWALQAGLVSSLNSAYGIRVGLLYVHPMGGSWFLQPQLGITYMTGYDKAYTHLSVNKYRPDSSWGNFITIDSTTTPYVLKSTIAAAAGVNAGYQKNKLTVGTGLVYSFARAASGNRDSSRTNSRTFNDSTFEHPPVTGPAFGTGRLPGVHQLNWNIDASYYVLPKLQLGINYRMVILRSAGDKGFQVPIQRIQDNSQLELYIRIPIGK